MITEPPRVIQKKICMVGDYAVGKTSLIRRYVHNVFEGKYLTTIGVHISKKEVSIGSVLLRLIIWDLAGEDGFHKLSASYLAGSSGAILVGDLSRAETMTSLEYHRESVFSLHRELPFVIALNKNDLCPECHEKVCDTFFSSQMAAQPCFRTSSKTGQNVPELFQELDKLLVSNHDTMDEI